MINNKQLGRFELEINGSTTYANYALERNTILIKYVFAPEELRGTGAASKLMEEIVKFAREQKLKITPICGYAGSWLTKRREHHDLLATTD